MKIERYFIVSYFWQNDGDHGFGMADISSVGYPPRNKLLEFLKDKRGAVVILNIIELSKRDFNEFCREV